MKRLVDVLVSGILLVALLPVLLVVALAIRLDGPGEIVFRQQRVGRNAKPFEMYKFRSMISGADRVGAHFTAPGDARVTRVGRILRKSSLDELPQLINVLKGEMSLVGPRPDVPAQRAGYTDREWELRHRVKPGITGLAQATARAAATPEERKRLDMEYASHASLLLDLKIMAMTVWQVIAKGSH